MRLSIVIPAADGPSTLARCVEAVRAASRDDDEIVVVSAPAGLNAAEARNLGIRRSTADVVVFVDADVVVHRDALTRIREHMERDPGLAGVFGAYDDAPGGGTLVSDFRNLLHHHVHRSGAGPAGTFWTGLGAVRRAHLEGVGGFDEGVRWIEDIELGMRLTARGARIQLDPGITGTHLKRWTLHSMLWTDFRRRGASWVALLIRRRDLPTGLNLGWRHRLSAALSTAGVAAAALGRARLAAACVAGVVGLNAGFYRLLARRLGAAGAIAGVGLHMLHHVASVAAVPAGVVLELRRRSGSQDR